VMPSSKHLAGKLHLMRRTLTIEDDVDAALEQAMRESGRPFKEIVNEALRSGLLVKEVSRSAPPLRIRPLSMGLKSGLSLQSVSALEAILEEDRTS
jgi:hypothetical protein